MNMLSSDSWTKWRGALNSRAKRPRGIHSWIWDSDRKNLIHQCRNDASIGSSFVHTWDMQWEMAAERAAAASLKKASCSISSTSWCAWSSCGISEETLPGPGFKFVTFVTLLSLCLLVMPPVQLAQMSHRKWIWGQQTIVVTRHACLSSIRKSKAIVCTRCSRRCSFRLHLFFVGC